MKQPVNKSAFRVQSILHFFAQLVFWENELHITLRRWYHRCGFFVVFENDAVLSCLIGRISDHTLVPFITVVKYLDPHAHNGRILFIAVSNVIPLM